MKSGIAFSVCLLSGLNTHEEKWRSVEVGFWPFKKGTNKLWLTYNKERDGEQQFTRSVDFCIPNFRAVVKRIRYGKEQKD